MEASKQHKKHRLQPRGRKAWCWCCSCSCSCNCRLSVSSSEEAESSDSDRFSPVSSLAVHAVVQERLDQMINQRHGRQRSEGTKFVVMVAMEKCSYDPREDFRESMVEMITANRIQEAKDLRNLLNYYVSMNSDEYHGIILEVFHEVCRNLFFIL